MEVHTRRRFALGSAAVLGFAALLVTTAAVTGQIPLFDDAPSAEQVIRDARARGVEGPIYVPPREQPDANAQPERYGPYLLIPQGWKGTLEQPRVITTVDESRGSTDTAEVRTSPMWREPSYVPAQFRFTRAVSRNLVGEVQLMYADEQGKGQFVIYIIKQQVLPIRSETWNTNPGAGKQPNRYDKIEVEGRPAILSLLAEGVASSRVSLDVFDESTGIRYVIHSIDPGLSSAEAIEVAKGLLP